MSKLKDGQEWLASVLGDAGRANSLITRGRDQNLFTKGKRGGIAPDLILSDFPMLCLCALTDATSKDIGTGVEELFRLTLWNVGLDNNDGKGWTDLDPKEGGRDLLNEAARPFNFEISDNPLTGRNTVMSELMMLFMKFTPKNDFGHYDFMEVERNGDALSMTIELHEVGWHYGATGGPEHGRGNRAIKLCYDNGKEFDPAIITQSRQIGAAPLNGLAALTKWMAKV
jgi:hypothetical protein